MSVLFYVCVGLVIKEKLHNVHRQTQKEVFTKQQETIEIIMICLKIMIEKKTTEELSEGLGCARHNTNNNRLSKQQLPKLQQREITAAS